MGGEKTERYSSDNESTEALLPEGKTKPSIPTRRQLNWTVPLVLNVLFFISFGMLVASIRQKTSLQSAIEATSIYTPVFDDTDIHVTTTQLNGSLHPGPQPGPWYGLPTNPIAEAAWNEFEHIRTIPLTKAQVLAMGKDPSLVAKFEDSFWGMGEETYVGALDFFHQIHCLNMLRKAAFSGNAGLAGSKAQEVVHLQHCTDMLMQHMLCTADAGMITYQWREGNEYPFPDFSVQRECRDWRQLVEWRDGHAVDLERYKEYRKPEGVEVVPWGEEEGKFMRWIDEVGEKHEH
ncbi:hypothetical protein M409DRAFT_36594 [Zasmidium cellare ATCC 36951]|uniref:Tat pathway signal sequence n=1 Tax=Zasmidium cellare ATCC 36951 TaxID=1080233 RepID=A0A6A6CJW2_ZASCE|nr:uncharacterized protein M409DRAFT_36594 [Zasmidium cellare ATCC 36951]KAF2167514.1 hypothetical protein M409DRAFT_36594 [Zasmidium cellare ATCC 36951]